MEYLGAILEILKCAGVPLSNYVEYHRKLEENMNNLNRLVKELKSRKMDVEETLKEEYGMRKSPKEEVKTWLRNVDMISSEVEDVEKEVNKRKYLSRARLSNLAEEKIQEVKQYQEKGSSLKSLVVEVPLARGVKLPTTTLAGEKTQSKVKEVWAYLMGNELTKIGVCGIGGVGKTTIITHINNKLLQEKDKFHAVIWVTVSQPFDLNKLQDQIASLFNGDLTKIEDKKLRAGRLSEMFEGKKFVLILDDMWEPFSLVEAGIPEPTKDNGCKLVITTRSQNVCDSMGCKVVRVEPLSKNEALNLFLDKVELDISKVPTLKELVELVIEQCAGLPLAIITVASCMRRVDNICEWRNALNELSNHLRSNKFLPVISQLQFSYDRLKDEKLQHCFLYCALFPEDDEIPKDELICYWITEGLLDEMETEQARYDRSHSILNTLVKNCLLENAKGGSCVKMHDLVRDMALHITSESPLFMIKAGMKLKRVPSEEEWKGNLEKVSLMMNEILEIPSNMSPKCEALSTLFLQCNGLHRIPESFFAHMPNLKILDLSYTQIRELPNSICDLGNLTGLLLKYCQRLKHVRSLSKLLSLRNLNLENTGIEEVPRGMEMLENLRYLNLCSWKLDKVPVGMLSKLRCLRRLKVWWGSETLEETIEEAAGLRRLDTFGGNFSEIRSFNIYVKSIESGGPRPKAYKIIVWPDVIGAPFRTLLSDPRINMEDKLLPPINDVDKYVTIYWCKICEKEGSLMLPEDVQSLNMRHCDDLRSLCDILLFNGQNGKCLGLKVLCIYSCSQISKLFSPKLFQALKNLEVINVYDCVKIEDIIASDNVDEEEQRKVEGTCNTFKFILPNLRNLSLRYLENLKSICGSNGELVCDSLKTIEVLGCPKLKRFPLSLSSPLQIEKIKVERNWWESVEWEDNVKKVLEPYCEFW